MTISAGVTLLPSSMGACCSVFLIMILVGFTALKTFNLTQRKDVNISSTLNEYFYDHEEVFDYDKGLNFAVGFTAYDNDKEIILDHSIGTLDYWEE